MTGKKPTPLPEGPLYLSVKRRILEQLAAGEWKPGDRLPTEPELAARFGVAISTVRAGLADLSSAGIVIKRQGKGNFVATHDLGAQQFRFSNMYDNGGRKLVATREIHSLRRIRASSAIRKLLALNDNASEVIEAKAVMNLDQRPIAILELVLPAELFVGLERKELEQEEINFYSLYQRRFGITVLRMEERIAARIADAESARRLDVKPGHPLLLVERTAFTFGNRPVEVRRRLYEGLQHHYLFTHDELE